MGKYDDYVIEDNENFIIINKPSGVAVQAGTKSFKNIIDAIKNTKYFENSKPYIVHRIDKETSGLLIIAKNRQYAQLLTSLFRIRKIHKTYLALVYGKVNNSVKTMKDELTYFENKKKITHISPKLFLVIIYFLMPLSKISKEIQDFREFLKIAYYYATESMLIWDEKNNIYSSDKTPEFGKETIEDYYKKILNEDMIYKELKDQKLF